jgi:type IV secretion system protein VirB9
VIRAMLFATTALVVAAPAFAQIVQAGPKVPEACSHTEDPAVRCIPATADRVVVLRATRGASLLIEVPDGERVVGVPTSDEQIIRGRQVASVRFAANGEAEVSGGEEPTTDGNLSVAVRGPTVVLKPHRDLSPQPFFVLTERTVGERTTQTRYRFRLETVPAPEAFYSVRLRNVVAEATDRRAQWERISRARGRTEAQASLEAFQAAPCAATPNANYRYVGQGAAHLAPSEVCDDGRFTYMRFPGSQRMPAIEVKLPGGQPALANWTALKDGWIQVNTRAVTLTLRQDEKTALCLHNRGFDAQGTTTGTGTLSPGVVRVPAAVEGGAGS